MQFLVFILMAGGVALAANVARHADDDSVATTDDELLIKVCEPGDTKMKECNRCFCVVTGWACTRMGCPKSICQPGTVYKYYCNTCQCPENGSRINATCTSVTCPEGMWHANGTRVNPEEQVNEENV